MKKKIASPGKSPLWADLTEEQQRLVRQLVRLLARPRPDLVEAELVLTTIKVELLRAFLAGGTT